MARCLIFFGGPAATFPTRPPLAAAGPPKKIKQRAIRAYGVPATVNFCQAIKP